MKNSEANDDFKLLLEGKWGQLWNLLKQDQSKNIRHTFLLGAWAQQPALALKQIPVLHTRDPMIEFVRAYLQLCIGNEHEYKSSMAMLNRLKPTSWMIGWLQIEYLGRKREYSKQAQLVEKHRNMSWAYIACLQSLDHQGIDPLPLLKVLHDQQHHLAEILRGRLELVTGSFDQGVARFDRMIGENSDYKILAAYYRLQTATQGSDLGASLKAGDLAARHFQIDKPMGELWLRLSLCVPAAFSSTLERIIHLKKIYHDDNNFKLIISSYELIYYWISGKYKEAYGCVDQARAFYDNDDNLLYRHHKIYFKYILNLCMAWQDFKLLYTSKPNTDIEILHVIGESHSLSPNKAFFQWASVRVQAKSYFVMGLKMWHLGSTGHNYHKAGFNIQLANIPQGSLLLVAVGEIDCRPDEGIWMVAKKNNKDLYTVATDTVGSYIEYLDKSFFNKGFKNITLQGVPAPAYPLSGVRDPSDINEFLQMIRYVNNLLYTGAKDRGWNFLDVHTATTTDEGISNNKWHIDGYHLKPIFYDQVDQLLV